MPFGNLLTPLLTSLALLVVIAVVTLYAFYWVVRRAVAHGIRDARRPESTVAAADRLA